MSYYDTFVKINSDPKTYYLEQLQELTNDVFDNSSSVQYDIEEETLIGSGIYQLCDARIVSLIDAKSGKKNNDDFKKIIFRDINHKPQLGTKYIFSNNTWLVYETNNLKSPTASVYIQRCNNTINIEDQYGNIHKEPCCIDYNLLETKKEVRQLINVAAGRVNVMLQYNQYTQNINIGDRIMLGKYTYQLRTNNLFEKNITFDKNSVTIMSFFADFCGNAEDDNEELEVANYKIYNYSIECQTIITNIINYTSTIDAVVLLDGSKTTESVLWYSSDVNIIEINETTGEYILKNIGNANIICKMKNNINITKSINVNVIESLEDNFTNVISPNINYIKANKTQEYYVYEYNNGIKTDTSFSITASGVPTSNYILTINDNKFTIKNLKYTPDQKLKVICHNNRTNSDILLYIELGGMF